MKIVFMGTPDFAVPCLSMLIDEGYEIPFVVTQPDKKRGRGQKVLPTPVKEFAIKSNLEVLQPETLKNDALKDELERVNPDVIVVVAYGKILPEYIINYPKFGCINVHASLLPKLRGAAPIQWSIINGDETTGITTMLMDKGLDTGDILLRFPVDIDKDDNAGTLYEKLKAIGATALKNTLIKLRDNKIVRIRQNEEEATYAPMIKKSDALINWAMDYKMLHNRIRGLNPMPAAYSYYKGKKIKIYATKLGEEVSDSDFGKVWGYFAGKGLGVVANGGILYIRELQMENSKRMSIDEFIKGNKIEPGEFLNDEN